MFSYLPSKHILEGVFLALLAIGNVGAANWNGVPGLV